MSENLTQPIGAAPAKKAATHIDDWLEFACMNEDRGTRYAWFVLHHARLSAVAKNAAREFTGRLKLFCTYQGARYRVTGASRMGDVWLAKDYDREAGYDLRINVDDCLDWSDSADASMFQASEPKSPNGAT